MRKLIHAALAATILGAGVIAINGTVVSAEGEPVETPVEVVVADAPLPVEEIPADVPEETPVEQPVVEETIIEEEAPAEVARFNVQEGVCTQPPAHIDGGNQTSIVITAPPGKVIIASCVKAGSINQGDGPEYHTYPGVASITLTHSTGKQISHYTVTYQDIDVPYVPPTYPPFNPLPCTEYRLEKWTSTYNNGVWSTWADLPDVGPLNWGEIPSPRTGHYDGTHGQNGDREYAYVVAPNGTRAITTGECAPVVTLPVLTASRDCMTPTVHAIGTLTPSTSPDWTTTGTDSDTDPFDVAITVYAAQGKVFPGGVTFVTLRVNQVPLPQDCIIVPPTLTPRYDCVSDTHSAVVNPDASPNWTSSAGLERNDELEVFSITVAPVAGKRFANREETIQITAPFAEETDGCEVTPVAPTVTTSTACRTLDTYTIPATDGVDYLADGDPIEVGVHDIGEGETVVITAVAREGKRLTDPEFTETIEGMKVEKCLIIPTAFASPPTSAADGVITLKEVVGLRWLRNENGTFTAEAEDGYEVVGDRTFGPFDISRLVGRICEDPINFKAVTTECGAITFSNVGTPAAGQYGVAAVFVTDPAFAEGPFTVAFGEKITRNLPEDITDTGKVVQIIVDGTSYSVPTDCSKEQIVPTAITPEPVSSAAALPPAQPAQAPAPPAPATTTTVSPPPTGSLPVTGGSPWMTLWIALGALGAGYVIVRMSRRSAA